MMNYDLCPALGRIPGEGLYQQTLHCVSQLGEGWVDSLLVWKNNPPTLPQVRLWKFMPAFIIPEYYIRICRTVKILNQGEERFVVS